jgi:hypothetical protein
MQLLAWRHRRLFRLKLARTARGAAAVDEDNSTGSRGLQHHIHIGGYRIVRVRLEMDDWWRQK